MGSKDVGFVWRDLCVSQSMDVVGVFLLVHQDSSPYTVCRKKAVQRLPAQEQSHP